MAQLPVFNHLPPNALSRSAQVRAYARLPRLQARRAGTRIFQPAAIEGRTTPERSSVLDAPGSLAARAVVPWPASRRTVTPSQWPAHIASRRQADHGCTVVTQIDCRGASRGDPRRRLPVCAAAAASPCSVPAGLDGSPSASIMRWRSTCASPTRQLRRLVRSCTSALQISEARCAGSVPPCSSGVPLARAPLPIVAARLVRIVAHSLVRLCPRRRTAAPQRPPTSSPQHADSMRAAAAISQSSAHPASQPRRRTSSLPVALRSASAARRRNSESTGASSR